MIEVLRDGELSRRSPETGSESWETLTDFLSCQESNRSTLRHSQADQLYGPNQANGTRRKRKSETPDCPEVARKSMMTNPAPPPRAETPRTAAAATKTSASNAMAREKTKATESHGLVHIQKLSEDMIEQLTHERTQSDTSVARSPEPQTIT